MQLRKPMNADEKIEKLYVDMYVGEGTGNPPVTLRLDRVERAIERFGSNSSKIVWLLFGTLVTVAGDVLLRTLQR
jgi:hypothetical protein